MPYYLVRRVNRGIEVVKKLKKAQAMRKAMQGADVGADTVKEIDKLGKDVSKALGGTGQATHVEQHVVKESGEMGAKHVHAVEERKFVDGALKKEERFEGHIFLVESAKAFVTTFLDANEDGVVFDLKDQRIWANELLSPLPTPVPPVSPFQSIDPYTYY